MKSKADDKGLPGQPLFMAGTMTVEAIAFGELGEYNFSATQ